MQYQRPVPEIGEVRNIQPKTREERGQSRDEFEKSRLRARLGGFQRYADASEVLIQPPDSLAFADEADRFNRDSTGMEKLRRDAELAKREMMYYHRRIDRAVAEEERWKQVDSEFQQDEQALIAMRESGLTSKRNKESVPYDLLTMQYGDDREGEQLRYSDDQTKVRSTTRSSRVDFYPSRRAQRARSRPRSRARCTICSRAPSVPASVQYRASHRMAHLHSKDNNTGYNPISGVPVGVVQTLARPRREDYGM